MRRWQAVAVAVAVPVVVAVAVAAAVAVALPYSGCLNPKAASCRI